MQNIETMTIAEAKKLGVQQYRDGKTFAAFNVRPQGFLLACMKAKRLDLVDALDAGWHTANLAEPVVLEDGTVIGLSSANARLEAICDC